MNNIKFGIYKDNRLITVIEASCLEEAMLRVKNLGYGEDYRLEDIEEFEITEKAVRKDGDVTICDLLNKEIGELTKQKEIEEMAKILKGYCCLIGGNPTKGDCYQCRQANASCYNYAEHIYNAGYRNCKDKVVVDKEELASQIKASKEEQQ